MLAVGLCQECSIADSSCQMLNWLCSGTDLSVVMRQNNLATLRQMNGLDRLSNLLCPEMEAHDELKPIGKITTPVFGTYHKQQICHVFASHNSKSNH